MKTCSPSTEITALVNLCSGLTDVKTFLIGSLKDTHFGVPAAREVYTRVFCLVKNGKEIPNIPTLLEDPALSEEAKDLVRHYKNFQRIKNTTDTKPLLSQLNEYRKIRICYDCSEQTLKLLQEKKVDINQVINLYESSVLNARVSGDMDEELIHIGTDCNADLLVKNIIGGNVTSYIPTGFKSFDNINGGLRKGALISIASSSSGGKAQPLYSLIKTPDGWIKMGNIKVGDIVSASSGEASRVTHVFPQGLRPTYRITFEDGRTTDCDENHLWKVYSPSWGQSNTTVNGKRVYYKRDPWRVLSLKEILKLKKSKWRRLYIPLPKAIENTNKILPLDPYVLGLLLGDGHFGNRIGFSNIDKDILDRLSSKMINGYCLKKVKNNKCDYSLIREENETFKICNELRKGKFLNYYNQVIFDLKLAHKYAWEKFIPEIYKKGSIEQRLELLRGLSDTDGEANYRGEDWGGSFSISTSSHKLALDIQYLVRSLGGLCKIRIKKSYYKTKEGIKKRCKTRFKCCIRYNEPETLFKLSRKADRVKRAKEISLKCEIKSIKYLGIQPTQCIMINHPDHLYITDSFVVTHNSCCAVQLLINMYRQGYNVALVSLEMDHEEIVSRILSNICRLDSLDILLGRLSEKQQQHATKTWEEFVKLGKQKNCKYSIYCPVDDLSIQDVCFRLTRFGYAVLIVDYVSLLDVRGNEPWKALGEVARFTKRFIKKMDMVGVLLCQLNDDSKVKYSRAILEHSDNVWAWQYSEEIARETGHIITIDQQKARSQQRFSFRVSERFNYMMLTDYEGEEPNDGSIIPNQPSEEFSIEDDSVEY
jgi:replicative DNA helicase